ncbi:uncharacterized protein LOC144453748 [Glandiceps talaboti]
MTEVVVVQRTDEWFELRQCVQITASQFGEALGIGRGKPYDFFKSLLSDDSSHEDSGENEYTRHGNQMEPIINEAYQLLTGRTTQESGFWLPTNNSFLKGLVGASPDAKVLNKNRTNIVGLAEYKAPVHRMYDMKKKHTHQGIPRNYMAQMQGQMFVCDLPWCDFMAVCCQTREIKLLRVYAQFAYWLAISTRLHEFCMVLKEARERKSQGLPYHNFEGAMKLKSIPVANKYLPGEASIVVEDLLEVDNHGRYRTSSQGIWMDYDFLMGDSSCCKFNESRDYQHVISSIDDDIIRSNPSHLLG